MKGLTLLIMSGLFAFLIGCEQRQNQSAEGGSNFSAPAIKLQEQKFRFDLSKEELQRDYIPYTVASVFRENQVVASEFEIWIHFDDIGLLRGDDAGEKLHELALKAWESKPK